MNAFKRLLRSHVGWALVAGQFRQREVRHVGPWPVQCVAGFGGDRLELLVLREAVVLAVLEDDRGVDDGRRFFDVDEGLGEVFEIFRPRGPDAVPGEVVARGRGSPDDGDGQSLGGRERGTARANHRHRVTPERDPGRRESLMRIARPTGLTRNA